MKQLGSARAFARRTVVVAAAVAAAGCGGGGGGGGSTLPAATIDVTAANQDTLARAAAVAVQGIMFDTGTLTAAGAPGVAVAREAKQAVVPMATQPCSGGGSISATLDDSNGNGTADVGETVTAVFDQCNEGGDVSNGTLTVTPSRVQPSPFAFDANAVVTAFETHAADGRIARYDGGFVLSLAAVSATVATTRMTVSSSLRIAVTHPQYTDTVTLDAGFVVDARSDVATALTTMSAQGTLQSATAGGRVQLRTLDTIRQADADPWPSAGRIELQGKIGSLAMLVENAPAGGTRVRAELDANGDDVVDASKTLEWTELL